MNILLLQSRVLANTDSRITDGCSPQVAVNHKGANLASVTVMNMGSDFVSRIVCSALNSQLRQILLHPQHDIFNLIKIQ